MNEAVSEKKDQERAQDPLDAPYVVRRTNQNPSGTWTFKPWIRVKPGTDLLDLLHSSRDSNVVSCE